MQTSSDRSFSILPIRKRCFYVIVIGRVYSSSPVMYCICMCELGSTLILLCTSFEMVAELATVSTESDHEALHKRV